MITKKVKTKEYWDQVNHLVQAQGYKVKTAKEMSSMAMREEAVIFHATIRKRDREHPLAVPEPCSGMNKREACKKTKHI